MFCYTETDQQQLRNLGVSSRIEVIPNGIDTELFSAEGFTPHLVDTNGPVLLFVGRFVDGKCPDDVIRAYQHVHAQYPETTLYLCRWGPMRTDLEALAAQLGIRNSVRFLGEVPYQRMPEVYRSSNLLVLPSRTEGVPRAVLEARSCGLPVVVSDLPQLEELLSGGYYSVKIGNISQISEGIRELLDADCNQREQVNSWDTTVKMTTEALYSIQK